MPRYDIIIAIVSWLVHRQALSHEPWSMKNPNLRHLAPLYTSAFNIYIWWRLQVVSASVSLQYDFLLRTI